MFFDAVVDQAYKLTLFNLTGRTNTDPAVLVAVEAIIQVRGDVICRLDLRTQLAAGEGTRSRRPSQIVRDFAGGVGSRRAHLDQRQLRVEVELLHIPRGDRSTV